MHPHSLALSERDSFEFIFCLFLFMGMWAVYACAQSALLPPDQCSHNFVDISAQQLSQSVVKLHAMNINCLDFWPFISLCCQLKLKPGNSTFPKQYRFQGKSNATDDPSQSALPPGIWAIRLHMNGSCFSHLCFPGAVWLSGFSLNHSVLACQS